MAFEYLVGLKVVDNEGYREYREAMAPIMMDYGGSFNCDFVVAEVLKAPEGASINRVFTIRFPSSEAAEGFFADSHYLKVKERHFTPSVSEVHILAQYKRPA